HGVSYKVRGAWAQIRFIKHTLASAAFPLNNLRRGCRNGACRILVATSRRAAIYRSATSFSEQDGRHRDRTRTHPVNVGRAVPFPRERSDRNAILPAFL